jgi:hypothetical protein
VGKQAKKPRGKGWGEEALLGLAFAWAFFAVRGLYDLVPFLFALGIAGCVAFVALRCMQLLTQPKVNLLHTPLKASGKLQPKGHLFVVASILILGWIVQSSWIQFHGMQSARAFKVLAPVKQTWFTEKRMPVDDVVTAAAEKVLVSGGRAIEAGLLGDPRRLMESAWAALILEDPERFEDLMTRAQAAAPRTGTPSVDLSHQAWASGDLDRAAELLARAVEIDPDLHQAWGELVELEANRGRLDGVLKQVRRGLKQRPADARLYDLLGSLYAAQGKQAAAQAALSRALTLDPLLAPPRIKLAQIRVMQGQHREARRLLREGLKLTPGEPALKNALAELDALGRQ